MDDGTGRSLLSWYLFSFSDRTIAQTGFQISAMLRPVHLQSLSSYQPFLHHPHSELDTISSCCVPPPLAGHLAAHAASVTGSSG
jgi:hypothetical protein